MSTNSGVGFGANAALLASIAATHAQGGTSSQSFGTVSNPAINTAMMMAVGSVLQQLARLRKRGDRQGDADLYNTRAKHESPSTNTDPGASHSSFHREDILRREARREFGE